jgi:hypothetical protein
MTGKEIIKRIINHDAPPRIGFDFLGNNPTDIISVRTTHLTRQGYKEFGKWNRDPALTSQVPSFNGELLLTPMGDIYGRLEGKTKGECVKGALQDGWHLLDSWVPPQIDEEASAKSTNFLESDKYILTGLPFGIFSSLRDCRHMDNALMDTLLEPDYVRLFLDKIVDLAITILDRAYKKGINGIMVADDLGTQINLFFSPVTFRDLFKPYYKKFADETHNRSMDFFLHSCGKVYDIVGDLVDAGVDVFQFDQPELSGSDVWAREFGQRVVFHCPVDIQKIMITGNRQFIEQGALNMVNCFKQYGGSLIAKDYPSWGDINVKDEWAQWARDVIIANAQLQ